jgi:DNA-binding transcriptional ArsR family regulator
MSLQEIKKELDTYRQQLLAESDDLTRSNVRTHLSDNLVPLFDMLVTELVKRDDEVDGALDELEEAVDSLIEESSEVLHQETAAQIIGVFELGKSIALDLRGVLEKLDDTMRKRVAKKILSYIKACETVTQTIAEITIEPEADELPEDVAGPSKSDDDGDDDGDDDDDDKKGG